MKSINKQFNDQNKSSCIAVKCKQWQLGDIYIHFKHFKVGRIDDIFYQIILWFHFVPLSESNNIYKYVPKNAHVFVIQNGANENRRK